MTTRKDQLLNDNYTERDEYNYFPPSTELSLSSREAFDVIAEMNSRINRLERQVHDMGAALNARR